MSILSDEPRRETAPNTGCSTQPRRPQSLAFYP